MTLTAPSIVCEFRQLNLVLLTRHTNYHVACKYWKFNKDLGSALIYLPDYSPYVKLIIRAIG